MTEDFRWGELPTEAEWEEGIIDKHTHTHTRNKLRQKMAQSRERVKYNNIVWEEEEK